ncbi:MAG: hypothetical protein IPG47_16395 [Thermoflexaceae bacterium]|nr:hypothetical protein [Thermoflexaceae bacterium]
MAFEHIRRVRRSARVARTGALLYVGYKRTQRRTRGLGPEAAAAAWEARHEASAERLYHMAVDLKGGCTSRRGSSSARGRTWCRRRIRGR